MAAHYIYLKDHALLFEKLTDRVELKQVLRLYDIFGTDPDIALIRLKLTDLRDICEIGMSQQVLDNLLDLNAKQYLRRLDTFTAGVLVASDGPGLNFAHSFFDRLPQAVQPRFQIMPEPAQALAHLKLPPDIWNRLDQTHLTTV